MSSSYQSLAGSMPRSAKYRFQSAFQRSICRISAARESELELGDQSIEVDHVWGGNLADAGVWHVRTRDELRLGFLLARHFQRGRGQALNASRTGDGYSPVRMLLGLREAIIHALRRRCVVGLINAARGWGRLGLD